MQSEKKPSWDDIRPLIEAARESGQLQEEMGRALDKWTEDVWNAKRATSDDFPAYFLAEHQPLSPGPDKGRGE